MPFLLDTGCIINLLEKVFDRLFQEVRDHLEEVKLMAFSRMRPSYPFTA